MSKLTYLYGWLGRKDNPTLFLVAARYNPNTGAYNIAVDGFYRWLLRISLEELKTLHEGYLESSSNGATEVRTTTLEDLFIFAHLRSSYEFETVKPRSQEYSRVTRALRGRLAQRASPIISFSEGTIDGVLAQSNFPHYYPVRLTNYPVVLKIPKSTLEDLSQ